MEYLREFVLASCIIVVMPFYYMVYNHQPKKQYNYYEYSLAAPIWFGVWNVISYMIAKKYKLTKQMRFLIISFISYITIILMSTIFKTYQQTNEEWRFYYAQQFVKYMITWNIVIYFLDKYI